MEIERKFLVNEDVLFSKIFLIDYKNYWIEQAYISTEDNEVRVRKIEDTNDCYCKCYLTIKSKGDLVRNEIEIEIPYGQYANLIKYKMYKGNIINKIRYIIPLENELTAELDFYGGDLFGLVVVEVEFKTEEEAKQFKIPDWFSREITNEKVFKNRNLALMPNDAISLVW